MNERDLASCEPSRTIRDKLTNDLNVQGQLACPTKIDMRGIIPTYDLSPQLNRPPLRSIFATGIIPIAGFVNYAVQMIPLVPSHYEDVVSYVMKNYFFQVNIDAAGRALLAGVESFSLRMGHRINGVTYPIAHGRQNIRANPGTALYIVSGSYNVSMSSIIAYYIPAWEEQIQQVKDLTFLPGEYPEITFGLDAANFPANSTAELTAVFDCIY